MIYIWNELYIKSLLISAIDLFSLYVFSISDHVMSSWEFAFNIYAYIWKKLFPRVASRGLKWENKTYKLKRSIA